MPAKKPIKLTEKQVNKYIEGIYDGSITQYDLSVEVYESIVSYLREGLYKGFGQTLEEAEGADLELLQQLRENVYMFGAAKNYQMTKEISSLLVDDDGNVRTAKEFNDIARDTYDNWNDNWGATEYQTAIGQAKSASKWNEIEKQKEVLPNLRYSAIMDANTSDICAPLNGLVAPVDDPIWDTCAPLNHFNCRCVLLQEDAEINVTPDDDKDDAQDKVESEMSPVFKSNPGKDGEIFNKDHPYFDVPKKDQGFAKKNFDLGIPPTDGNPMAQVATTSIKEAEELMEEYGPSKSEEEAMKHWGGTGYGQIQHFLRNGAESEAFADEMMSKYVKKIDSYLTNAPKFEGTTFRGLQFESPKDAEELVKMLKSGQVIDKGFMATTADKSIAADFMEHPGKIHISFEVEGKNGVLIDHITGGHEKEVLFPRNTKFKVLEIKEKDGYYWSKGKLKEGKDYRVKLREI